MAALIDLIGEAGKLAELLRKCKDRAAAKAQYQAWQGAVVEHLKDDPLVVARFNNAQPVLPIPVGIASGVAGYWQKVQGQLPVLIAIAGERKPSKPDELFTAKPSAFGFTANLKEAWRRDKADWQKWWAWLSKR